MPINQGSFIAPSNSINKETPLYFAKISNSTQKVIDLLTKYTKEAIDETKKNIEGNINELTEEIKYQKQIKLKNMTMEQINKNREDKKRKEEKEDERKKEEELKKKYDDINNKKQDIANKINILKDEINSEKNRVIGKKNIIIKEKYYKENASTNIQSLYRGYRQRKKEKRIKKYNDINNKQLDIAKNINILIGTIDHEKDRITGEKTKNKNNIGEVKEPSKNTDEFKNKLNKINRIKLAESAARNAYRNIASKAAEKSRERKEKKEEERKRKEEERKRKEEEKKRKEAEDKLNKNFDKIIKKIKITNESKPNMETERQYNHIFNNKIYSSILSLSQYIDDSSGIPLNINMFYKRIFSVYLADNSQPQTAGYKTKILVNKNKKKHIRRYNNTAKNRKLTKRKTLKR